MIGAITAGLFGIGVPPVTNSYESIQTYVVGSGGQSTVSFTVIPSTYKHLQIRYLAKFTGTSIDYTQPYLQFNSDTSSSSPNHALYGVGSNPAGASYFSATGNYLSWAPDSRAGYANMFGNGVVDVLDYANTSKNKTIRTLGGFDSNGGNGLVGLTSAAWLSTSAISTIDVKSSGTFAQYSSFALYGIKG